MNVPKLSILLLCDIPDPAAHPAWAETADNTNIREAIRGLATTVNQEGGFLTVQDHPAVTPFVRPILTHGVLFFAFLPEQIPAIAGRLTHVVMIGGMQREIDFANELRRLRPFLPVLPIASTGAAAAQWYDDHAHDFHPLAHVRLAADTAYGPLFDRLLLTT